MADVNIDGRGLDLGTHVLPHNHSWQVCVETGTKAGTHVGEIGERIVHLLSATPSCWLFNQLP